MLKKILIGLGAVVIALIITFVVLSEIFFNAPH